MKIAILSCNNFSIIGGAEQHIFNIANALNADVISYGSKEDLNPTLNASNINFIFLNKKLPPEPLKYPLGIYLFKTLKLPKYNLYICIDDISAYFITPDKPHLYYTLTPRRALYDMYYPTLSEKTFMKKLIYYLAISLAKLYDQHHVKNNITNFACISNNIRSRIYKTYQKEAGVVYPCIHTNLYHYQPHENFWLSVSRIDKWKRVNLQIEAFRQLPDQNLVIVGTLYPEQKHILNNLPPNITFHESISNSQLISLYSRCTGFITTAIDEDFGLTPLEAMASGKPVIAAKEGGYLETIIDNHTGILITPTTQSLISAVQIISSSPEKYKEACLTQAKKFDYEIFQKHINTIVHNTLNK